MRKSPLATCPWCKKEPVLEYYPAYTYAYWYSCTNEKCPVQPTTQNYKTASGAKRAWNRCRRSHEEKT